MYLSRIPLNAKRRETMRAIASPHILHGAVELGFPRMTGENGGRLLWRVDYLREQCYLLVLSALQPEFKHIAQQFGYEELEKKWETKSYTPLLARIKNGQVWRFRLCANPVHSSSTEKSETSGRGKIYAHVTPHQQRHWLLERAPACGFSVNENTFDVVHTEWKKFQKVRGAHKVVLRTADFEGFLTVSDAEAFKHALTAGIGRAKAYGCGLLTIVRTKYHDGHDG